MSLHLGSALDKLASLAVKRGALQEQPVHVNPLWRRVMDVLLAEPEDDDGKVILILTKFGILISTWFQIVPFGLRFSKQFLFLMYDPSFCCP